MANFIKPYINVKTDNNIYLILVLFTYSTLNTYYLLICHEHGFVKYTNIFVFQWRYAILMKRQSNLYTFNMVQS